MSVNKKVMVGVFELVEFPGFGGIRSIAKLDTGAYSGALHCEKIREESSSQGKILKIIPLDSKSEYVFDEFAVRYVKSSNGLVQKRYFIDTLIIIKSKKYPIVMSLTNRQDMKWKVLIGRKFLRQHGFVVDANKPSRYVRT